MSAKTGRAPTFVIASAVAMNVWAVVITSSPGPMPSARRESSSAAVPELTPTAPAAPTCWAQAASNARTSSPRMKLVLSRMRWIALSISPRMDWY